MEPIEIRGVNLLTEEEKKLADELLNEYYPKIQRRIKNIISLKVHIKEYKKDGTRKKYSINVSVINSTDVFEANAHDWDFARTMHKVLNKIENEIEGRFHSSNQHTKTKKSFKSFSNENNIAM